MGFSSGAYACTEVLATGRLGGLSCCCLGGLHGNGSPDPKADGITGKHHEHFIDEYQQRFKCYLTRLRNGHVGVKKFLVVHSEHDQVCRMSGAKMAFDALDEAQKWATLPSLTRNILHDKHDRHGRLGHGYLQETMTSFTKIFC